MRKLILFVVLTILMLSIGCAGTKMSVMQPNVTSLKNIHRIAIAPGSGVLGDAIAQELFNMGAHVVDAQKTSSIIGRAGLSEFEVTTSKGYSLLREKGINAVLSAKAIMAQDGRPENASVRVTNTSNGDLLVGVIWQNGWGRRSGSIADRAMRVNLSEAAQEIARELRNRLALK